MLLVGVVLKTPPPLTAEDMPVAELLPLAEGFVVNCGPRKECRGMRDQGRGRRYRQIASFFGGVVHIVSTDSEAGGGWFIDRLSSTTTTKMFHYKQHKRDTKPINTLEADGSHKGRVTKSVGRLFRELTYLLLRGGG